MDVKSLQPLRISTLVVGWVLLGGVFLGVLGQLGNYFRAQADPTGFSGIAEFDILKALSSFFSGFGNSFLAFLIAAVFRMLEEEAPVGSENARRLMIVCCLSYMAEALTGICSFIVRTSALLTVFKPLAWGFLSTILPTVIPALVPVLYATSIFILYTHFTKMVTFESEVA